ncbi:hypothetical protein BDW42DRAFT_168815 [Aspergillus taichungensis]|uniref:Uncharacterized protein n=1 Tax=Aspergillus taichungensis TaxID=482145 RepID=A0A2J5HW63_9EURO|nr:hypothetical protein BDW42DRAFT_168815 [Aspergillus taichungensis]
MPRLLDIISIGMIAIVWATRPTLASSIPWRTTTNASRTALANVGDEEPTSYKRCDWNSQCDYGYVCDQKCTLGCTNTTDCLAGQTCKDYRCHTEEDVPCGPFGSICGKNDDCCSGQCKRIWFIWIKKCQHGVRRAGTLCVSK